MKKEDWKKWKSWLHTSGSYYFKRCNSGPNEFEGAVISHKVWDGERREYTYIYLAAPVTKVFDNKKEARIWVDQQNGNCTKWSKA